jgi:hypothetical protein
MSAFNRVWLSYYVLRMCEPFVTRQSDLFQARRSTSPAAAVAMPRFGSFTLTWSYELKDVHQNACILAVFIKTLWLL